MVLPRRDRRSCDGLLGSWALGLLGWVRDGLLGSWAPGLLGAAMDLAGGVERVLEEHRNRHGAHAPRDRRDGFGNLRDFVERDVTHELVTLGIFGIIDTVDADIDYDDAGLHHTLRDHLGTSYSRDQDVRRTCNLGEVFGSAMGDCDGRIAAAAISQQQERDRPADDRGAPHYDDVFAAGIVTAAQQHLDHAGRSARRKHVGIADCELARVHGMKAVDILRRVDCIQDFPGIDVFGYRHLHENAMYTRVAVQFVYDAEEFGLAGLGWEVGL